MSERKPMTKSGHCTFGTPPAHHLCHPERFAWTCDCPCHTETGRDTPGAPPEPAVFNVLKASRGENPWSTRSEYVAEGKTTQPSTTNRKRRKLL